MKFHIRTYGCQMNVRDTESVTVLLERHGYTLAQGEDDADIIIVNTCSVRGKAEDKALGKLGLMTARKRDAPKMIIGAIGCMVERLGDEIFKKIPRLDFAVGPEKLSDLPNVLNDVLAGRTNTIDAGENQEILESAEKLTGHVKGRISEFINILFGCNRYCSYCIVPSVRGRERSRSGASIVKEVAGLTLSGVKEVTLLGQSVMSYGICNDVWPSDYVSPGGFKEPLARLLEAVAKIDGIERIRFTSGHASGCSDELIRAMAEIPKVCKHMHLPIQSGSDRILKMMGRGYTVEEYLDAVARLRSAVDGLAVTTDIIVGFPTETEEDFQMTMGIMNKIGFDNAFIFKYSTRPGTKAAEWDDDILYDEKVRRNKVLLEDQNLRGLKINEALIGKSLEVLVEGVSPRNSSRWLGRTSSNKIVVFDPPEGIKSGDLVNVSIERAMAQTLYGTVSA